MDRKVSRQRQARPPCARPAVVRHRCRRAPLPLRRDLRYVRQVLGRAGGDRSQQLRHASWCHRQGARPRPSNLQRDREERSLHEPELQLGEAKDSEVVELYFEEWEGNGLDE